MGLRRSIMLSISYIYRRISSPGRNSRYWPLLILAAFIYVIVYLFIQEKPISSSAHLISHKNNSKNPRLTTQEPNKDNEVFIPKQKQPSLVLVNYTTNDTKALNESSVIVAHDARLRYSFIDVDHLNVDVHFLDEVYQPPKDLHIDYPSENTHPYSHIVTVKGNLSTIIYNRIPQSYEFTMGLLLKQVSYLHSFKYISSQIYTPFSYNHSSLISIGQSLNNHKFNRLLYDRHIYFFDFYKVQFPQHPVWINLVRDPIYRVAADFKRSREVCRQTNRCFVRADTINDTLDTCVIKHPPQVCISPENGVSKVIPFFCGLTHAVECQEDSAFALQQAKQNIEFFYTVVGVAEDFYAFLYVLEKLFPQYFKLARLIYMNTRNPKQFADKRDINVELPNSRTIALLQPLLKYEYDLYDFIKKRFRDQYEMFVELDN